jgi:uncharacterized protein YcfL
MLTALLSTALLLALGCGSETEQRKEPKPQQALVSEQPAAKVRGGVGPHVTLHVTTT